MLRKRAPPATTSSNTISRMTVSARCRSYRRTPTKVCPLSCLSVPERRISAPTAWLKKMMNAARMKPKRRIARNIGVSSIHRFRPPRTAILFLRQNNNLSDRRVAVHSGSRRFRGKTARQGMTEKEKEQKNSPHHTTCKQRIPRQALPGELREQDDYGLQKQSITPTFFSPRIPRGAVMQYLIAERSKVKMRQRGRGNGLALRASAAGGYAALRMATAGTAVSAMYLRCCLSRQRVFEQIVSQRRK